MKASMQVNQNVDILLVDDREDGLIALEALLGHNKSYNLVKARSGRDAYSLLANYDFAVILLDVQMPGLDGFETAELIRKDARFSAIPILFVTAINKDDRYVYRGYEAGAVDYIFKPFDPFILLSKVSVFVDLHLKKRELREQTRLLQEQEALRHQTEVQSLEIESLRRYINLANAIPHIILKTSQDGNLEYWNKPWTEYTGYSDASSRQTGWHSAFHEKDLKGFLSLWMASMTARERFEMECRLKNAHHEYRWYWIKAVPDTSRDGHIQGWILTGTDIHDRKIAERKIGEAQKNAEAANAAKTQFLANMSHEIRTPLNAIIGFTDLMLEPTMSPEERANSLSVVRRNGHQLVKIIDEILDISKVEAGGLEIEWIDTDLTVLVSEIRSLLRVSAAKKMLRLHFQIEGSIPNLIVTDATRLRQILINLVGNAIKFTPQGKVEITLRAASQPDGNQTLIIEVADSGIGIAEEFREKVFTPFLQADSSTTRRFGGTGLGLTLSRKLARALGGDLWLKESRLGAGSTFVVQMPLIPGENAVSVSTLSDFNWDSDSPTLGYEKDQLKGTRILLAEDAEDNQLLISHYLSNLGAVIDIARNGQEAVEKALSADYEAILMDIQMPILDGYEATSRLRQAGFKKPIIALTAHALPEDREKSLRTGCDAHLSKPLDKHTLVENLIRHTGRQAAAMKH